MDVTLGGQGAPLVPIGDELLFSEYNACLNLGGFANISNRVNNRRVAFDVCPSNIVLNALAQNAGLKFDEGGTLGRKGTIHSEVVNELDHLDFYRQTGPKSLGKEWVDAVFMPTLCKYSLTTEDMLACVYEHVSRQIGTYADRTKISDILVTGGGAFNDFLVEKIKAHTNAELILPGEQIIKFKEGLIFAFLGMLRYRNEINCLASVTGASRDSSSGVIHLG